MKGKINQLLVDTQDHPKVTGPATVATEYQLHPRGYKVAKTTRMILQGPDKGRFLVTEYVPVPKPATKVNQSKLEAMCSHFLQLVESALS